MGCRGKGILGHDLRLWGKMGGKWGTIRGNGSLIPGPGLCLVFGLGDRGGMGGGVRAKKKLCVPKMGLSLLALCSNSKFHFSPEAIFLVFGGWVVWPGGGGPPDPPPPPPRVDKHIPGPGQSRPHAARVQAGKVLL